MSLLLARDTWFGIFLFVSLLFTISFCLCFLIFCQKKKKKKSERKPKNVLENQLQCLIYVLMSLNSHTDHTHYWPSTVCPFGWFLASYVFPMQRFGTHISATSLFRWRRRNSSQKNIGMHLSSVWPAFFGNFSWCEKLVNWWTAVIEVWTRVSLFFSRRLTH